MQDPKMLATIGRLSRGLSLPKDNTFPPLNHVQTSTYEMCTTYHRLPSMKVARPANLRLELSLANFYTLSLTMQLNETSQSLPRTRQHLPHHNLHTR